MAFGSSVMRQMFNGSQPSEPALPAPRGACLGPSSPASLMFPDVWEHQRHLGALPRKEGIPNEADISFPRL